MALRNHRRGAVSARRPRSASTSESRSLPEATPSRYFLPRFSTRTAMSLMASNPVHDKAFDAAEIEEAGDEDRGRNPQREQQGQYPQWALAQHRPAEAFKD